jgi:hypothetical protein|tara:strand:+ start:313 stop:2355 length:2043 start_codon:yes stop_codon:yes gene_type:complete
MEDQEKVIEREDPKTDGAKLALISKWHKQLRDAKNHHREAFQRIREDMDYALKGKSKEWNNDKYVANIIQRHINQAVANLYAKNPRAVAKRRTRLEYRLWDGDQMSLMQASQSAMMTAQAGVAPDPNAMMLIEDVQAGQQQKDMMDKLAKTLEILFHYYLDEQQPNFKRQMKQVVRRAKVCGVAYLKLGLQRIMEKRPEYASQIADVANQIARIEAISADVADGEIQEDDAKVEELKIMMEELQAKELIVAREGVVFDFPRSTEIIVDPKCRHLNGFIGATWVCHEMAMTADEIKEVYEKDIGKNYTHYNPDNPDQRVYTEEKEDDRNLALVWEVWDKDTGTCFTVVDGYKDWLKEPATPDVMLERFWPFFTLTFNDIEDEEEIYPISDVSILRPMQDEYNRSRQGLREHRLANRPKYAVARGRLEEEDKDILANHPANAILELNSMVAGETVDQLLQPMRGVPIDPALYETNSLFEDILRTVGTQEANLGGVSGATATETSIAENSRSASLASNVDDLDDMLSELARATGQLMLLELSQETVMKIVGPGAVWPEFSRAEISEELFLEVRVGSSGRPNKAAELANLERAAPTILQIPGISPVWFAKQVLERLDETGLDIEEAIIEGMPSMIAQNQLAGNPEPATGDAESDPAQQGGEGSANAAENRTQAGPQPSFPTTVN